MTARSRLSLLMVVAAAAACLVVAAAAAHGDRAHRHAGRSVLAHAAALQGLAELAPHVAALRIAHGPSDAVADQVVHSALLSDGVADPALARRVGFSKPTWLVPASDGRSVCLLTPASLNCPRSADVEDHGLAPSVSWSAQGPVRVSGIASDAVSSARVVMADDSVQTVDITNNLLDFASEQAPREVLWTGPDGPHAFVLPDIKGR